ncbi:MAG TPA: helix-turn-helix domain-containing protein [Capillimicrobium sp.]|nr:helix-turn-helix domain-containing protein [Capillimicrobium sp.]
MAAAPARAKRADAVRNRERVVAAAEAVLAERGLDATVPEIAAAAGVGKGTVYRSFPTKEHLVAAIACRHLDAFAAACDEAARAADPVAALTELLVDGFRRKGTNRLVAGAMAAAAQVPELVEARAAVAAALERVIDAGRASGALRADARADDVRVLLAGISHVLVERDERDGDVWGRYAELAVAALRA